VLYYGGLWRHVTEQWPDVLVVVSLPPGTPIFEREREREREKERERERARERFSRETIGNRYRASSFGVWRHLFRARAIEMHVLQHRREWSSL
jgi:hypothetical protein